MRRTGYFLISLCALLTACAGGGAESGVNSTNNTGSTGSMVVPTEVADSRSAMNTNVTAATSVSRTQTQFAKSQKLSVAQQVSLIKAEQVASTEYSSDRKIVRNAEIDLEAESPEDAQRKITSIAEMKGGFVVESQQSASSVESKTREIVTMSVRVPSLKFGETLDEIRQTSSRIVTETIKGQDVTEEFIDVEAQLKAKKALEAQFMEIMKRASRVDEALSVQSELADVRGEIERVEGRKRFLENQSSLSTIKLRIQTAQVIAARSQSVTERLSESFNTGFDVAMSFILGLVTVVVAVLPFALLIGLPTVLLFRYFWLRQMRPKSVSEIAREEIT